MWGGNDDGRKRDSRHVCRFPTEVVGPLLPLGVASAGVYTGVQVVDDPVHHATVDTFHHAHVVQGHMHAGMGHLLKLATVEAGHTQSLHSVAVGPVDRGEHVAAVAGTADGY